MSHLVRFFKAEKEAVFWCALCSIADSLDILGNCTEFSVDEFYGYVDDRQVSLEDVGHCSSIEEMRRFLESWRDLFITTFAVTCSRSVSLDVNDDAHSTFVIRDERAVDGLVLRALGKIGISKSLYDEIKKNNGKYLWVENSCVVRVYETFDEYVQSDDEVF